MQPHGEHYIGFTLLNMPALSESSTPKNLFIILAAAQTWANIQLQWISCGGKKSPHLNRLKQLKPIPRIYKRKKSAAHCWINARICQRHNEKALIWHQILSGDECAST